jgi:hypothetical protein
VGNPIEASRGGVAHRTRTLGGSGGSAKECVGARSEDRRVAPVVGLVGTGASWWSSRMGRQHWTRTRGGRQRGALRRRYNQRKGRSERQAGALADADGVSGVDEATAVWKTSAALGPAQSERSGH